MNFVLKMRDNTAFVNTANWNSPYRPIVGEEIELPWYDGTTFPFTVRKIIHAINGDLEVWLATDTLSRDEIKTIVSEIEDERQ